MKSLVTVVIHGLALIGAQQIYQTYQSAKIPAPDKTVWDDSRLASSTSSR